MKELRTLLERFANNTSMDIIFDAVDVLVADAQNDQALGNWFSSVDAYIRKVRHRHMKIDDSDYMRIFRCFSNLATCWSQIVTAKLIAYASLGEHSTMTSTAPNLTICSVVLEVGSALWAKTLYVFVLLCPESNSLIF